MYVIFLSVHLCICMNMCDFHCMYASLLFCLYRHTYQYLCNVSVTVKLMLSISANMNFSDHISPANHRFADEIEYVYRRFTQTYLKPICSFVFCSLNLRILCLYKKKKFVCLMGIPDISLLKSLRYLRKGHEKSHRPIHMLTYEK